MSPIGHTGRMDFEWLAALTDMFGKNALLLLEYLKVTAWPIVILTLALLYKKPLVSVLSRLRKVSGFGAILELERESQYLAIAARQAEAAGGSSHEPEAVPKPDGVSGTGAAELPRLEASGTGEVRKPDRYLLIANVERVQRSWAALERLSQEMGADLQLGPWKRTPADVARELTALGYVSHELVTIAQSLDKLRQRIALAEEDGLILTSDTAESFEAAVASISSNFKRGMAEFHAYQRSQDPDRESK